MGTFLQCTFSSVWHTFWINEVPVGFTFLGVKDYPENVCNEKADFHLNEK